MFLAPTVIPSDILIKSGKGAFLETTQGELIDLASMTVNCILGQNDPWVSANQVAYILSGLPSFHSTKLGSPIYYSLPKRLANLNIGGIKEARVNHRQCNGSDIVDLAIKSAYDHRGTRRKIISLEGSYHGQGLVPYIVSDTQKSHLFLNSENSEDVIFLKAPSNTSSLSEDRELTLEERETIEQFNFLSNDCYAVILEPIQMNNGANIISKPFIQQIREICTQKQICLIFDEIQTGFGWLGKLSAADVIGISPDILLISKALTSGNGPLAIIISSKKYANYKYGTSEKTNGADLRSLVAANAVLDRLIGVEDKSLLLHVEGHLKKELEAGILNGFTLKVDYLVKHLKELKESFPQFIAQIKGDGLLRAIEIIREGHPDNEFTRILLTKLLEKGVFVRQNKNFLIVKPPLIIETSLIDNAFFIIRETLKEFSKIL